MGIVISFISVKGGVGKTTVSLEVASALANDFGKKVLLVDANFSSPNISLYLNLNHDKGIHEVLNNKDGLHNTIIESYGIDVVPASLNFNDKYDPYKLKNVLEKHKERYDFIIIDSSPHHSEMLPAIAAADKIFLVTTPDRVTLMTSIKAAHIAKQNKTPIEGIIVNKIRNPKHEFDIIEIEKISSLPVLAKIKDHKKILEASFNNMPLNVYDSLNEISKEIKHFARAISGEKEKNSFFHKIFPKEFFGKEKVNREMMRIRLYEPGLELDLPKVKS